MKKSLVLGLLLMGSAHADDIRIGQPGYGGTGCPAGTVSATLSPDRKSLSILFDSYVAEAGTGAGRSIARKSCNVAIPVHVPQGMSVSIFDIEYRGFNSIPRGGYSQFNVEYFFAGQRGPKFTEMFRGPLEEDYYINDSLEAAAIVWSPCGQDVTLRTNSSLYLRTNSWGEDALSTLDSQDIKAGIEYLLQFRSCH